VQKCAKRCKSRRVPARKFLEKTREILPRKGPRRVDFWNFGACFHSLSGWASGPRRFGLARLHEAGRPRIGQKFTTLLSQNSGSKRLAEMRFGSRKQGENENSRSNLAGGFETDTRCRNFVSKLFRSRNYELSARTIVANLPKVVSKVGELWSVVSGRWPERESRQAARQNRITNLDFKLRTPHFMPLEFRTSNHFVVSSSAFVLFCGTHDGRASRNSS
jgi:hypothetical protein